MSISVASIGFVLPQNRQLMLKGEKSSPITPTLWNEKNRKIDLKLDKKLKIFKNDFIKNRTKIYEKGSEKLWEIEQ